MTTQGIILTVLLFVFAVLEVSALVAHWFEKSKGVFLFKNKNQTIWQIVIHSSFDQIGVGLIVNYENIRFIQLHIFNLNFCIAFTPKKYRAPIPVNSLHFAKPTIAITEWMRNGIEKAEENFPGAQNTFYFKALEQGYTMDDVYEAIEHWRVCGANASWDKQQQEIILTIPNGNNN